MSTGSNDKKNNIVQELPKNRICATCPTWLYQMGANKIDFTLIGISFYHLFALVIRRTDGATLVARGGPSGSPDGSYGKLIATLSSWEDSIEAGRPGLTFRDLETSEQNRTLTIYSESERIHNLKLDYAPTGPNSNSFAMSVVEGAGLPALSPVVKAPGKGMRI